MLGANCLADNIGDGGAEKAIGATAPNDCLFGAKDNDI